MKKLIYGGLFLALVGTLITSCTKEQDESRAKNEVLEIEENLQSQYNQKVLGSGPGIRIFTVEIHRPVGKTNRHGQPCECRICVGFCDFEWFPDFSYSGPEGNDATLAIEAIGENLVRMYFFDSLDLDGAYMDRLNNPLFHIDENILLDDGESTTIIFAGEYSLYLEGGILETEEGEFEYNSFIDVEAEY